MCSEGRRNPVEWMFPAQCPRSPLIGLGGVLFVGARLLSPRDGRSVSMGFPHGELVVLSTVVLAGIAGMLWLAGRAGGETSEDATSLRRAPRGAGASPAADARSRDE